MVRDIVTDVEELKKVCSDVDYADGLVIANELRETAISLQDKNCCGLAGNQIGYQGNVLIARVKEGVWVPMINPRVLALKGKSYVAKETNLSLGIDLMVRRYPQIVVVYTNINGKQVTDVCNGELAQIVQHELNVLRGVFFKD